MPQPIAGLNRPLPVITWNSPLVTVFAEGTCPSIKLVYLTFGHSTFSCVKLTLIARPWRFWLLMAFHDMMTSSNGNIFSVTGPLWGEITGHRWISSQSQGRGALTFSLICAWTNGWANHWDAGDLRRHRAHYNVTVMKVTKMTKVTRYIISICPWSKWSHLRRIQQGIYFMWSVKYWPLFGIMDHLL